MNFYSNLLLTCLLPYAFSGLHGLCDPLLCNGLSETPELSTPRTQLSLSKHTLTLHMRIHQNVGSFFPCLHYIIISNISIGRGRKMGSCQLQSFWRHCSKDCREFPCPLHWGVGVWLCWKPLPPGYLGVYGPRWWYHEWWCQYSRLPWSATEQLVDK